MPRPIKSTFATIALPIALWAGAAAQFGEPALLDPQPPLLVYDFNLGVDPAGNVDHVESLGFDGLVTRVETPSDLLKLRAYAEYVETTDDFDLLAFLPYDFSKAENGQVWRSVLPLLADLDAPLWVIVRKAPSEDAVRQILSQMAIESQVVGVATVIYPHWDTDIESAAEASALIRAIGHPNLQSSLHTCHEIRVGNQSTLDAVAEKHAPVSALVTIAGADADAYAGPFHPSIDWSDAIKPLDEGAFSLLPFLEALRDSNYSGPVVLHTFGIADNPGHLERSLRRYTEYVEQLVP